MSDDGGIQYWQTVGQQEEYENEHNPNVGLLSEQILSAHRASDATVCDTEYRLNQGE